MERAYPISYSKASFRKLLIKMRNYLICRLIYQLTKLLTYRKEDNSSPQALSSNSSSLKDSLLEFRLFCLSRDVVPVDGIEVKEEKKDLSR